MDAIELYKKVENVPEWAQKQIGAGRLKGMTDINPQWRILMLVENFGFCGIGWKYEVNRVWIEPVESEVVAFAEISLYVKVDDKWSDKIPGIGGSKLVTKESAGLHVSDECYKMAITDALSVACKMLGIGAAIYSGSKYDKKDIPNNESEKPKKQDPNNDENLPWLNEKTLEWDKAVGFLVSGSNIASIRKKFKVSKIAEAKLIEQSVKLKANV